MQAFNFTHAKSPEEAVATIAEKPRGYFLGGGTNLIDLLKEDVEQASDIVDLTRLDLAEIKETPGGGVMLGALAKNSDTANHPLIRTRYPLLTQAMLSAASAQIRNMATNGGNLLQRTRCMYFYDVGTACNKREPGTGCSAIGGLNRMHAIFGASPECVATHPSDFCVALAALEATVHVRGVDGKPRAIPFAEFHRLPGDQPQRDNNLAHGELIEGIELPASPFAKHYHYLKVRDRASYAFALVSVAAALELDGDKIKQVRLAMGGVAHKPWRAAKAEAALAGKMATAENFAAAAEAELADAKPLEDNAFKIPLGKSAIVRALTRAKGDA